MLLFTDSQIVRQLETREASTFEATGPGAATFTCSPPPAELRKGQKTFVSKMEKRDIKEGGVFPFVISRMLGLNSQGCRVNCSQQIALLRSTWPIKYGHFHKQTRKRIHKTSVLLTVSPYTRPKRKQGAEVISPRLDAVGHCRILGAPTRP
jgi:hypothetical protein